MAENKLKALIVDNDTQLMEVMKSNLESKGCLVRCASNQKTAQSLLINEIFHIAFIDCVLDSGEGTELIRQTKKIIGSSVDIIMMSGIIPEKSLSRYIDMGICDFLSKPISDKEIEEKLSQAREKYIYGGKKGALLKLFNDHHSDIQRLKTLISAKKAKGCELFLYLGQALSLNESISLTFQLNNKTHTIICKKGAIAHYECDNSENFLNRLLSSQLITHQEFEQLKGRNEEECVHLLLKGCILSSGQILDVKYELVMETLKSVSPDADISLAFNLVSHKEESFDLLNQSEYASLMLALLREKFSQPLQALFDKEAMAASLVFKNKFLKYPSEIQPLVSALQSGMRLKGAYSKLSQNQSSFYASVFCILLKGAVYLSENTDNLKYNNLYERFQSLNRFVEQTKQPERLFSHLSALPHSSAISAQEIKHAYSYFIKHNHPDVLPSHLPKNLLSLIDKTLSQIKLSYDLACDPDSKKHVDKKLQEKQMEKEILVTEKKKICERHLEEEKYDQAFALIQSVPPAVLDSETYWQLLYLWLYFKDKSHRIKKEAAHKHMKHIQIKRRDLQKDKLCQYVFGLYHESKQNDELAKTFFERAKVLDPSFQPCYSAIKKCSLRLLRKKQENQTILDKINFSSLGEFVKKLKKPS